MRVLDLAWAAGFFDGEGCTSLSTRRNSIDLTVNQIHLDTLERFRDAVGMGVIYGPRDKPGAQPQWSYRVFGHEQVQAVIAMLWPWLTPWKREQAAAALRAHRVRARRAPAHGTWSRYTNRKCRCEPCMQAAREYRSHRATS